MEDVLLAPHERRAAARAPRRAGARDRARLVRHGVHQVGDARTRRGRARRQSLHGEGLPLRRARRRSADVAAGRGDAREVGDHLTLEGARVAAARRSCAGFAWTGGGRGTIRAVDVSGDGGRTWSTAALGARRRHLPGRGSARRSGPARTVAVARATDDSGDVQPLAAAVNTGGYGNNSIHRVRVLRSVALPLGGLAAGALCSPRRCRRSSQVRRSSPFTPRGCRRARGARSPSAHASSADSAQLIAQRPRTRRRGRRRSCRWRSGASRSRPPSTTR